METKKNRFNIIDVVIILVVIALAAGIALRYDFFGRNKEIATNDTVIISFLIRSAAEGREQQFHEGDAFTYDGQALGELLKVSVTPAELITAGEDGEFKMTTVPGKVDIRGEIRAVGTITDTGFRLGSTTYLAANMDIEIKSKYVGMVCLITGIRPDNG